jgi:hypothetical protein
MKPRKAATKQKYKRKAATAKNKYLNKRIAQWFDYINHNGELHFGTIGHSRYLKGTRLWLVTYDDGDSEDLNISEIRRVLELYTNNRQFDPAPPQQDATTNPLSIFTASPRNRESGDDSPHQDFEEVLFPPKSKEQDLKQGFHAGLSSAVQNMDPYTPQTKDARSNQTTT